MKTLNLFKITAISCVLLFVSGTAMAVEDCAGGYLTGFITTDIIIPEGGSCIIANAIVKGKIEAVGAEKITINLARVSGRISIQDSGIVSVISNQATRITVARNEIAIVLGNVVRTNITVNRNGLVWIEKNQAEADLTCTDNAEGTAVENWAGGTEDCGPVF